MLTREYRICAPLTVEEFQVGQLYMIARHSLEASGDGEGVESITIRDCEDEKYGKGQYTEKHLHLSSRLPHWAQLFCPRQLYVTEKSWNYYPYSNTVYECSLMPRLHVRIESKYMADNGKQENCFDLPADVLKDREVDHIDIAFDQVTKQYKRQEDPTVFHSSKTGRGPLTEGWRDHSPIISCAYKLVQVSFEMCGFQTRVEEYIHRCIRDLFLESHRQVFTWVDDWIEMSMEDVHQYELRLLEETNLKMGMQLNPDESQSSESEAAVEVILDDAQIKQQTDNGSSDDSLSYVLCSECVEVPNEALHNQHGLQISRDF